MSIQILRNEVPADRIEAVARGIFSAIGDSEGLWKVDITSEPAANAWDIEILGPYHFYWARRFSGLDRDPEVIREAARSAVLDRAA